jgi:hypothetical protein
MEKKYVINMMLTEFDMYRHYLRKINKKKNYEWLRNMFHDIS